MGLEELLLENMAVTRQLIAALTPRPPGADKAFYSQEVALTSAHVNLEIAVGDFRWVQFWCDGSPIGITVGIATQDNTISLEKFSAIPVVSGTKVYVTNDVRSGRSKLLLVFSRTAPLESYLGGQISLAEVAARLGSIHTFDRRGDILWYDDFEDGIEKWEKTLSGTGAGLSPSNTHALSGVLSAKFVTGNQTSDITKMIKKLPYPYSTRIGVEAHFTVPDAFMYWEFDFGVFDGTNLILSSVVLNSSTSVIQILTASGAWVTIASSLGTIASDYIFHAVKLVIDCSAKKYVRLIWNNNIYDLSNYGPSSTVNATAPYLYAQAQLSTEADAQKTGYLDDVIVTQNEP